MRKATVSEAKNRLSEYLQLVERGETVLILRRDKPIARLVPIDSANGRNAEEQRLAELERLGIVRRPRHSVRLGWYARLPEAPALAKDVDVVQILIEQRGER
ncbi:MAG TPA: type II toxin-antitoxin system prevent-host-death family antitoxin [Casimicrobiaceae bacterium]